MSSYSFAFGLDAWAVDLPDNVTVSTGLVQSISEDLTEPNTALKAALLHPVGITFPLGKAFTPDDKVAVVLDERLPHMGAIIAGLLEYLASLGITPEAVTLITPPGTLRHSWIDDLPDELSDVRTESHNPTDRKQLSYLATTKQGRRVYLNKTLVDADQIVVLSGRGYDPLLGYSGGVCAVFPNLADQEVRDALLARLPFPLPGVGKSRFIEEAQEIGWLLGSSVLVQFIEGAGDKLHRIIAGLFQSNDEGIAALNDRWEIQIPDRSPIVVATICGDPIRQDFNTLAQAAFVASQAVSERGWIVILCDIDPIHLDGIELLRQIDDPDAAVACIQKTKPANALALLQWLTAVERARIYLTSGLSPIVVEEIFATPLLSPQELQRLIVSTGACLWLPDAHKCRITISEPA